MNSAYYADMPKWLDKLWGRISNALSQVGYQKEDIPRFILSLSVAVLFMYLVSYHEDVLGVFVSAGIAIVWGLITIAMLAMAGRSVFKALSFVGAGIALSVIIFLSQAYCAIPADKQVADDALRILVNFGLCYAGIQFLIALWKELFGNAKKEDEPGIIKILYDKESRTASIIAIGIYLAGVGGFIGLLLQVAIPILSNQCFMN